MPSWAPYQLEGSNRLREKIKPRQELMVVKPHALITREDEYPPWRSHRSNSYTLLGVSFQYVPYGGRRERQ